MKESKKKKLNKSGWKVGNVEEFLGLSPSEVKALKEKHKNNRKRS